MFILTGYQQGLNWLKGVIVIKVLALIFHQMVNQSMCLLYMSRKASTIFDIIIHGKFFFLFIGWKPTTWPANNCLKNNGLLMRNVVQLCLAANNILLMRKRNHVWYVLAWKKADRFAPRRCSLKNKLGDWMIKQLLNSVITKYRELPVSCTSIICLSLQLRQISDLLATDKPQYFAQPHPIIVYYWYYGGQQFQLQRCLVIKTYFSCNIILFKIPV